MVLEKRRTIICKSGRGRSTSKIKTNHIKDSLPRSKRVHHSHFARPNQHEESEGDLAEMTEISLNGDTEDSARNSMELADAHDMDLVERLIESAKTGDLGSFQFACARILRCHRRLDTPGYMGWTAAHWAAREGHVHLLEHLTFLHANLDAVDCKGDTLLHKAAANGQHHTCRWLLARGFNVKVRNKNDLTPLDLAQEHIAISGRSQNSLLCEQILSAEYSNC